MWGCASCERGAWCSDHTAALLEARIHAQSHGDAKVTLLGRQRGPKPKRDDRIRALRAKGMSIRSIARAVSMSTAGVIKSLRRTARS